MRQRTRLIINVLSNYGAYAVYGVANFFLVGYVARMFGKDLFGVAMLVLSLTQIAELIDWGVCLSLTKHISADVERKDNERFYGLVNTSIAWLIACGTIGAVICVILSVFIERISNMPAELIPTAKTALLLMGLRVLLCFPFNTFQGILWANQRYDLTNTARSIGIALRVIIVVIWFKFISAGLAELILITIFTMIIERLVWVYNSYHISGRIKLGWQYVSVKMFWVLFSFGGFVLVIQVSNLLGYEAIKWVVSIEMPVMEVGAYTLLATMAMFAGNMVRSIANVLMPTVSSLHASNQHDKNIILAVLSTKYAMVIAGLFCIVPLFLLKPFLMLWIGKTYPVEYLTNIAFAGMLLLIGQYIMDLSTCNNQTSTGMGKVAFIAMITMCWALGGLGGVWIYLHWFGKSIVGVVIIIAVARITGSIANLIYGLRMIGIPSKIFIMDSFLRPTIVSATICLAGLALTKIMNVYNPLQFVAAILVLVTLYGIGIWFVVFSFQERTEIINRVISVKQMISDRYNRNFNKGD